MLKQTLKTAAALSATAYLIYAPLTAALFRMKNALSFSLTSHPEKVLYLTFDDGPDPRYTGKLLDLLARYQIHATFFTVAEFAEKNPELIRRMQKEGHVVACHSESHRCAMFQGPRAAKRDLSESLDIMKKLGVPVRLYRAPWGLYNMTLIRELKRRHIRLVIWNVMIGDWSAHADVNTLVRRLLSKVRPGAVICLHDGRRSDHAPARTIRTLERALPELRMEGYQFRTL